MSFPSLAIIGRFCDLSLCRSVKKCVPYTTPLMYRIIVMLLVLSTSDRPGTRPRLIPGLFGHPRPRRRGLVPKIGRGRGQI